jgi:ATP-binding cassette subfamily F protein 1
MTSKNKKYTTLFATATSNEKINITVGTKKLINDSDLVINTETKYFLVGHNGCGKTTLLKHLYEKLTLKKEDVLMIDQDIQIEGTETIKEFILNANAELYHKYKQMTELEQIEELTDEQNDIYTELSEYVYANGLSTYLADSNKILKGLGFIDNEKKVSELSGGWRMRLALGKALLYKPNILFLDEPTNHLDINAIIWLTDYLETYSKTLVVVTHQISLLNTIPDEIWLIDDLENNGSHIYTIKGKYRNYIKYMEDLSKKREDTYNKLQKRVEEMRKKSKPKKEVDEFIKTNNIIRPPKPYKVTISFEPTNVFTSRNIIELQDVSFSYNDKQILSEIEFAIGFDSRYVIVGENGAGKTTLFKLCLGDLKPTTGDVIRDDRLSIAYYNQQIVEGLPLDMTALEYLSTIPKSVKSNIKNDESEEKLRGRLGRMGFKKVGDNDPCKIKINDLSGGQKARVALCAIQITNPHIILMDEPTNHLDMESIDALIEAINTFNGGIVVITHDIYLIESIYECQIYEVADKQVTRFDGDFDEYCDNVLTRYD